jgi:hypothetical protein
MIPELCFQYGKSMPHIISFGASLFKAGGYTGQRPTQQEEDHRTNNLDAYAQLS